MEKSIKEDFFKLLIEDDKSKLKKFLISNGKNPKAICPIMFVNNEDNENVEVVKNV